MTERDTQVETEKPVDKILVLDFGGQLAHLITRRFRDLGYYSELVPHDTSIDQIAVGSTKAIVLSGGPDSIYQKGAPKCDPKILELDIPILGICYGHQLLAEMVGGYVKQADKKEYGGQTIKTVNSHIFAGLPSAQQVWFSHGDEVVTMPSGFTISASSNNGKIAVFESLDKKIVGIQFHPESENCEFGKDILKNFAEFYTGTKPEYQKANLSRILTDEVGKQVGDGRVLMAVSGGVDSTVAATIIHGAIGNRLYPVFIDNGLLRKNEPQEVVDTLDQLGIGNVVSIDASAQFLTNLKGVSDPEIKRKIIASTFFNIFTKESSQFKKDTDIEFLGQGTIFPDRIESGQASIAADRIKTHHNIETPPDFGMKLIEPLKWLYKDEVRELGKQIGISEDLLNRHPFPGPGLAVRILGEVTSEKLEIVRDADSIFIDELKEANLYDKIWQAFAALLPSRAVGVKGDARSYDYLINLRAVTSCDAMTADWAEIPNNVLRIISSRILNEVSGVGRVSYDISQKPPATIEYE